MHILKEQSRPNSSRWSCLYSIIALHTINHKFIILPVWRKTYNCHAGYIQTIIAYTQEIVTSACYQHNNNNKILFFNEGDTFNNYMLIFHEPFKIGNHSTLMITNVFKTVQRAAIYRTVFHDRQPRWTTLTAVPSCWYGFVLSKY